MHGRRCRFIFTVNVDITLNRLYYFIKKLYTNADIEIYNSTYYFACVEYFKDKEKITRLFCQAV